MKHNAIAFLAAIFAILLCAVVVACSVPASESVVGQAQMRQALETYAAVEVPSTPAAPKVFKRGDYVVYDGQRLRIIGIQQFFDAQAKEHYLVYTARRDRLVFNDAQIEIDLLADELVAVP